MSSKKALDTGTATAPTPRPALFAGGMPSTNPATDEGVNTVPTARPGVWNPDASLTNPPSAPVDLGDQ